MRTIVTFSGGKDSLAALLWIRNNFTKNFTTAFCGMENLFIINKNQHYGRNLEKYT